MRFAQPASCWNAGLASYALQPEPEPLQTVSFQPRVFEAVVSAVPPTAVRVGYDAGDCAP